ncbi:probable signal recognition particle 9 kDa protein at N-terminal half [Coccomyxa sp. Obi]|nr:probable signal recognition particle 9 kDa protein at N-terminal half [Coccomyxa sp. Obi]
MFIEDWNSFYEQAEQLYRNDPLRTRYVLKYSHSGGKLVLKVTDDRLCLQFQTDQLADVKKVEKLNNLFFTLMAKGDAAEDMDTAVMADAAEESAEVPGTALADPAMNGGDGKQRQNRAPSRQQASRGRSNLKGRRSKG